MKLSPLTIILIGISFAIAVLSFGYFHEWVPNTKEAANYEERTAELEAEAAKLPRAKKRVDDALALVESRAALWRKIVATNTPVEQLDLGGVSLRPNAWQLSVDTQKYRNNIQRAVNAQVTKGGVKVISAPAVPGVDVNTPANQILASFYNYPAIAYPVVIFDLGTIVVEGTMQQIFQNVKSWKNMPRYLAVADGLRITGTSPHLTGTYNVSMVGFIRGKDIFPSVPEAAAGAAGGGGGGSPFGGRGGPPSFGPPGGIPGRPGGAPGNAPGGAAGGKAGATD